MKKICILLMMVALMLPTCALADDDVTTSPTPAPTDTEDTQAETTPTVMLEIDNLHVYEGMERSYQNGYIPTVKDGKAIVVLPLVASGDIAGGKITATPSLGDATSPFVHRNYRKTVKIEDNAVAKDKTIASYLVRFDLPLTEDRNNGVYPVTIDVSGQAADGSAVQDAFTTYVTITDGADPNAVAPTEAPETPVSQPKVIVSHYSVNPSPAEAGEPFSATITLKNTSDTQSVQNMAVTVSCDSPNIVLQNDSNVIYVSKLKKGETTDIEVRYETDLDTPAGRYNITLTMEYDNSDAVTLAGAGTVPVTVSQPLRVVMEVPQIPESANAGDTMPLEFQVMNMGRSPVYNVRVALNAPGLIPSETAFIGNMEAGTAMPGQMDVFVGTKNMTEGYEGDDKYGNTSGTITLIYEDAQGQEYTEETAFSMTIEEPVIAAAADVEPEEEVKTAGQWWISVVIGGVIIGGLAAFLILRKKRGKRYEAL